MKIVEHRVRSVDTIQSIAAYYLTSAERWREIADFNNLDYPYITTEPDFQKQVKASGDVIVRRAYYTSDLTVPVGTEFIVPSTAGGPVRVYKSTVERVISAGIPAWTIPVECTVPGLWGNIPMEQIQEIRTDDPTLANAFFYVGNEQPFTNGAIYNVKTLGDSILIPVDDSWDGVTTYEDIESFYDVVFGTDLELSDDGDLVFDGYGDLGSVSGPYNLAQAARDRLVTPKLSLLYHPEYGSILNQIAYAGVTPYTRKWAALATRETLLADDRIADVNVVALDIRGPALNVVVEIIPINQGTPIRLSAGIANLFAT